MRKLLVAAIGAATTLALLSPTAHAAPVYGGQGPELNATAVADVVVNAAPITRSEVIARAQGWFNPPIPYSQNNWHNGWRADCSGYVSMAWNLDTSLSTVTLPDVSHRIGKEELRAGDVMMNGGPGTGGDNGHVAIFERWVDDSHTAYWAYEQTPPQTVHRQVPYPYFGNDTRFLPYRYNLIQEDPQPQQGVNVGASAVDFRGQLTFFGQGTDDSLQHWWYVPGEPTHRDSWGGGVAGRPVAIVYEGRLTVFARSVDGSLHHWWLDDGGTARRDSWGGGVAGDPAVAVYKGRLTVFARGTDGSLSHWWLDDGGVARRDSWGGGVAGDPSVTVYGDGEELTVFARDVDGNLSHWWYRPGAPTGRDSWGSGVAGDPAALLHLGRLTVFARSVDGSLHHWWLDDGGTARRDSWGGGVAGDPSALVFNGDELTVYARDVDGNLSHWWYRPGAPTGRDSWAGGLAGDPTAILYTGRPTVFARDTATNLAHWWLDDNHTAHHDTWGNGLKT